MSIFNGISTYHHLKSLTQSGAVVTAVTLLASCGGSSGGSSDPAAAAALAGIQDDWVSECIQVSPNLSGIGQLTITETDYDQSTLFFVGSTTCSGQLNFLLSADGTYTLGAGTTITPQGVASHIDIDFGEITVTPTAALDAQLALGNTSFAELVSTELDIPDANNISAQDLDLPPVLFSLILVDGDTLFRGDLDSNQGNSAETRLPELSTEIEDLFTRQ